MLSGSCTTNPSGGVTCIRSPNAGSKPDRSCNLTPLYLSLKNRAKRFYARDLPISEVALLAGVREQDLQPNSPPGNNDAEIRLPVAGTPFARYGSQRLESPDTPRETLFRLSPHSVSAGLLTPRPPARFKTCV